LPKEPALGNFLRTLAAIALGGRFHSSF
jgi:hypothetical protein